MWIVGHAQVGWFLGRAAKLEPRDRKAVAWCGVLPDVDGLTLLGGVDTYLNGHHVYMHNLAAAVAIPAVAAGVARRRVLTFSLGVLTVLLHFASDGMGLLELRPLWPFSTRVWWPAAQQYWVSLIGEVLVPIALLAWSALVLRKDRVSILELITPRLDAFICKRLAGRAEGGTAPGRPHAWTTKTIAQEVIADVVLYAVVAFVCHLVFVVVDRARPLAALAAAVPVLLVIRWGLPWLFRAWLDRYARGFAAATPGRPED